MMLPCNGARGPFTTTHKESVSRTLKGLASMPLKKVLGTCSPDEIDLIKAVCEDVVRRPIDRNSLAYGLCCGELKVCSEQTEERKRLIEKLQDLNTCSDFPTQVLDQRAVFVDFLCSRFKEKKSSKDESKFYSTCTPKIKEAFKEACDKFNAKSADKETYGYNICCNIMNFCHSSSSPNGENSSIYSQTWFFAVCGGVGLLLIGIIGVVVYFFCIRKKRGGGKSGGGMTSSKKSTKSKNKT
ncbi:unnamed protein product [Caenorhabditis nigoni]